MNRLARARWACIAVIAGALTLGLLAGPAGGAAPCSARVLDDWSDNGRIDRLYPLRCYEEAIDAIPSDVRDYTNAVSVIERALTAAIRSTPPDNERPGGQAAAGLESTGSSFPLALVALGGVALAVLAAGTLAWASRRRSGA